MRVVDIATGLLLLGVVAALVYVVTRVLLWPHIGPLFSRVAADENKPVNAHLVGASGQLVAAGAGVPEGRLRVRIGMERWDATWSGDAPDTQAPGTQVRVVAVDGMTVHLVPASAESADAAQQDNNQSAGMQSDGDRHDMEPPVAGGEVIRT